MTQRQNAVRILPEKAINGQYVSNTRAEEGLGRGHKLKFEDSCRDAGSTPVAVGGNGSPREERLDLQGHLCSLPQQMSDLREQILRKTAKLPPKTFEFKAPSTKGKDGSEIEPIDWQGFWDSQHVTEDGFAVYRAGPSLDNSETKELKPYVFLLHGAGYTSLSWSLVASELKSHVNVVAYDFRGHGATHTVETDEDFSGETLSIDSQKIITDIIKEDVEKLKSDETPRLIIVGHSMGGAIAAKTALLMDKLWMRGLILVDIVEGTAIAALPSMQRIISSRPSSFKSVSDAILWSCKARLVQNSYSARISVPSQIIESPNASGDGTTWKWRTNLSSTEPYWKDWYQGLSKLFLSCTAPKVLILAGTDRLDQELTVGQMQGKFQMCLLTQAGHVIQEDAPHETAVAILSFLKRQKLIVGENLSAAPAPATLFPGY